MTALVLTVGGSHEPLVAAIRALGPERVVFLCSDDTPAGKGSYIQVVGQGNVTKSALRAERPDLPNIVVQASLKAGQYEVVKIPDFDSLQCCYRTAHEVIARLHRSYPDVRVVADYTGGTKSMSAGLAMAAVDDGQCEVNLVSGTRTDLDRVSAGTEFARPVAVWNIRGRRKMTEEVGNRLGVFDYAGAQAVLESVAMTPVGDDLRRQITVAIGICRGLDAWDRFDHRGAKHHLNAYRRYLVAECTVLDDLCSGAPKNPYALVEDLLLNADRRAAQHRYDDAVARTYRALEMIAQIRLRTRHGIDTSDVKLHEVPEQVRPGLQRHDDASGKVRIALFEAWRLLEALRDDKLAEWFAGNRALIQNWLGTRNGSILAHGLTPIDRPGYEAGAHLCREALGRLGSMPQRQLPTDLPELSANRTAYTG